MEGVVRRAPWWVLCVFGSACAQVAGEPPLEDTAAATGSARSDASVGGAAVGASFSCTGGADRTLRCVTDAQYCEQTTDGSTTIAARCVALPVTCYDDPCNTCLIRGLNGIVACRSSYSRVARLTTVTVRP